MNVRLKNLVHDALVRADGFEAVAALDIGQQIIAAYEAELRQYAKDYVLSYEERTGYPDHVAIAIDAGIIAEDEIDRHFESEGR